MEHVNILKETLRVKKKRVAEKTDSLHYVDSKSVSVGGGGGRPGSGFFHALCLVQPCTFEKSISHSDVWSWCHNTVLPLTGLSQTSSCR